MVAAGAETVSNGGSGPDDILYLIGDPEEDKPLMNKFINRLHDEGSCTVLMHSNVLHCATATMQCYTAPFCKSTWIILGVLCCAVLRCAALCCAVLRCAAPRHLSRPVPFRPEKRSKNKVDKTHCASHQRVGCLVGGYGAASWLMLCHARIIFQERQYACEFAHA